MPSRLSLVLAFLLLAGAGGASAQMGPGIYTCIDASGRSLTSDRPIPACLDREQKELNPSGTVRRIIGPSLTAVERAAREERERKLAEERQRQAEEKRLQRALLARYPNQAVHDEDRASALRSVQDAIASGQQRLVELQQERSALDAEAEFYKTPADWPPALKQQFEQHRQRVEAQQRFIAAQREEAARIDARFDEDLQRLKPLWAQRKAEAPSAAASMPVQR